MGNSKNHLTSLTNWLVPVEQRSTSVWKRCWRASVDDWASRTFHSRCDGKGPTVTIIRVGRYIFGGYTSLPWGTLIMKSDITLLQFVLTFTKYRLDKNSWHKFAIITRAQLLRFFPQPRNNVRRLYREFFPNLNFCKFGKERTARYFPKGNTVLSALRNFR